MGSFFRRTGVFSAVALVIAAGAQAQSFAPFEGNATVAPFGHHAPNYHFRTVVVIYAGDSVAQTQSKAGRALSQGERDSIKAMRMAEQAALRPAI